MNNFIKKIIRYFFAKPAIRIAGMWPSHLLITVMRKTNKIQLSVEQLELISKTIAQNSSCRFLVFGMGNDSIFWSIRNRKGTTVFVEDNKQWHDKIMEKSKNLTAYLVDYQTKLKDWKKLLESQALLDMNLPDSITDQTWDVILVDAPEGWNDQSPGRMKSIFLASQLIRAQGDVFVHDCNREIENLYCTYFLRKENLNRETHADFGMLRHYHIEHEPKRPHT